MWDLPLTLEIQIIEDDFDIKAKVEEILTESKMSDQRAAKMSIDDILQYVHVRVPVPRHTFLLHLQFTSPGHIFVDHLWPFWCGGHFC